jgi:hypothetical protein
MTDPGQDILNHPINALASNWYLCIMYSPISVPVLPSPALQCTATAYPPYLISVSQILMNLVMISSEGHDPSKNSKL